MSIAGSMTESSLHACAGTAAKAAMTKPAREPYSLGVPLTLRLAGFTYGVFCYAVFFVTFMYAFGFVGNFLTPTALTCSPRRTRCTGPRPSWSISACSRSSRCSTA